MTWIGTAILLIVCLSVVIPLAWNLGYAAARKDAQDDLVDVFFNLDLNLDSEKLAEVVRKQFSDEERRR